MTRSAPSTTGTRLLAVLAALCVAVGCLSAPASADGSAALPDTLEAEFLGSPATASEVGHAVAVAGDVAVVGARIEQAAYIYRRGPTGWGLETRLTAPGASGQSFGYAVAVGDGFVAIGAPTYDDPYKRDVGAVYVYYASPTGWSFGGQLAPSHFISEARFGEHLAADGDTLIVGSPGAWGFDLWGGAVDIFRRTVSWWTREAALSLPDAHLGDAVALQGDTAAIESGERVIVYRRNSGAWAIETILQPSDASDRSFGGALAIVGDTLVAGAPGRFGTGPGAAYIFKREASGWTNAARLAPPPGLTAIDFGGAVAIVDGVVAVSDPNADQSPAPITTDTRRGVVHLFADSDGWSHAVSYHAPDSTPRDRFGGALASSGGTLVVGAAGHNQGLRFGAGAAYVFANDGDDDGLTDRAEVWYGSDPTDPDTDGDLRKDGTEVRTGTDPAHSDAPGGIGVPPVCDDCAPIA